MCQYCANEKKKIKDLEKEIEKIKYINKSKDIEHKKNSNMGWFAAIGGVIGFFIGAAGGPGAMLFTGIVGASVGALFADQFYNK